MDPRVQLKRVSSTRVPFSVPRLGVGDLFYSTHHWLFILSPNEAVVRFKLRSGCRLHSKIWKMQKIDRPQLPQTTHSSSEKKKKKESKSPSVPAPRTYLLLSSFRFNLWTIVDHRKWDFGLWIWVQGICQYFWHFINSAINKLMTEAMKKMLTKR